MEVVNYKTKTTNGYPYLAIDPTDNQVVFFTQEDKGICIVKGDSVFNAGDEISVCEGNFEMIKEITIKQ